VGASGEAKGGRGGPLDALRFLAAAFIVLYHFGDDAPVPLASLSPVFSSGWLATDFFLMLSGYVLARAYGPRIEAGLMGSGEFVRRRVLKLWPAHAVVLVTLAVMTETARLSGASAGHAIAYDWAWFPAHLLWVQAWGLGAPPGWNMPAWSLSALVVCYVLFPLVWRRLAAASRLTAMTVGLLVLFGAAALAAAAHLRLADLPLQIGVLRAVPLFLFGAALARLGPVLSAFEAPRQRAWLAAAIVAGAFATFLQPTFGALLLIGAGIAVIGGLEVREPWAWAEKGAALSFPLFITHFAAGIVWFRTDAVVSAELPDWLGWPLWAGGFLFCFLVASLFARFVDRPIQAAIARLLERGRRRRRMVPAPAT
jgi:peptidoglycan/LPS O-acetylase OafA/YrhL